MMNSLSTRAKTTRLAGSLFALAFVAACGSETSRNVAGPSAAASPSAAGSTAIHASAATVRFYTAQMAPTAVASPSSNSYSVTITNDPSTTSSQKMGSATVVVPAGFTITSSFTVSATGGKHWDAALVSGVIQLVANPGTQKLDFGESVTVAFTATAPILANCTTQTYEWTSVGYNGTDFLTPYTLVGAQPSVTVTADCPLVVGCTVGQGFWKNGYPGKWPASALSGGLTLGSVSYTAAQLESIFNTPPAGGQGLLILAHQLIAAKLNIANGADPSAVASTIAAADALIGGLVAPPVGSGSLPSSAVSALATTLDQYNSGLIGPGPCPTSGS